MEYIALLRGVNISGKNKISMPQLKEEFQQIGFKNVITYLNSGNIIFSSDIDDKDIIINNIHEKIKNIFNIDIPVYVISVHELRELLDNSPNWWGTNNKDIYDNIIFIIQPCTYEEVYSTLGEPKESLEKIQNYKNNIFWSYNLKEYRKTNWWSRTANTVISNSITIRTANTIRKVLKKCNMKEKH